MGKLVSKGADVKVRRIVSCVFLKNKSYLNLWSIPDPLGRGRDEKWSHLLEFSRSKLVKIVTSFRNRQKENGERLSTRKIIFFESFDAVKYTSRDAEQGEGGEGGISLHLARSYAEVCGKPLLSYSLPSLLINRYFINYTRIRCTYVNSKDRKLFEGVVVCEEQRTKKRICIEKYSSFSYPKWRFSPVST